MRMNGGILQYRGYTPKAKEPLINSWLLALSDARERTRNALQGIFPEDSIVKLMRHQHNLLIGAPTGEKVYMELGKRDPQRPATMLVKGRSLVTGLPAAVEVSSSDVQAVDNDQASIPYLDWSAEDDRRTIGSLLYLIAVHEFNWISVGLREHPPAEVDALFTRDENQMPDFVRGKTLSQHWHRLGMVRNYLFDAYRDMTLADFQRQRLGQNAYCSAEWVLHELCQFEAECRTSIKMLFAEAKEALHSETPVQ